MGMDGKCNHRFLQKTCITVYLSLWRLMQGRGCRGNRRDLVELKKGFPALNVDMKGNEEG